MEKKDEKMIPASAALIPFAVLLLMLFFVIRYFGSSALEGASLGNSQGYNDSSSPSGV